MAANKPGERSGEPSEARRLVEQSEFGGRQPDRLWLRWLLFAIAPGWSVFQLYAIYTGAIPRNGSAPSTWPSASPWRSWPIRARTGRPLTSPGTTGSWRSPASPARSTSSSSISNSWRCRAACRTRATCGWARFCWPCSPSPPFVWWATPCPRSPRSRSFMAPWVRRGSSRQRHRTYSICITATTGPTSSSSYT